MKVEKVPATRRSGISKVGRLLLLMSLAAAVAGGADLHFKRRQVSPDAGSPARLEAPGPRWSSGNRSHLILQFRHPVDDRVVQELNRRGAFVLEAVPDFGVVVSADDEFSLDASNLVEVVDGELDIAWAGRLTSEDKISPMLAQESEPSDIWLVAEFFPDVPRADAARLAEAAGFHVQAHRDLAPAHLLLSGPRDHLAGLAQWDEVAYLFPASPALIRRQRVHRCNGALTNGGPTPQFVLSGSGWAKDSSGIVSLSYVFGTITPKLDAGQARQEIERALNAWTPFAPIQFTPGTIPTAPRTVFISFASRDHGDGFPFDGPGGVLAHTFYPAPPNPESIAGDMHLDADEAWHIGANTDLFTVALHEAGHALGLAHTDDPASIMYPYYRLGAQIGPDDIAGVQKLYGAPAPLTATEPARPLTLTITSPLTNSTTAGASLPVTGNVTNGNGPVQVTWQTDHGAAGSASSSNPWSIASVPLVPGSNTITVTAADSSGKAVQAIQLTRQSTSAPPQSADRTPPLLAIAQPAASISSTASSTVTVSGTASDNVGVVKVTWQTGTASGIASGTVNWSADAIPLLVGNNPITIRAFDAAGNMSWRSVLVMRR